jgi:hypothetical protein
MEVRIQYTPRSYKFLFTNCRVECANPKVTPLSSPVETGDIIVNTHAIIKPLSIDLWTQLSVGQIGYTGCMRAIHQHENLLLIPCRINNSDGIFAKMVKIETLNPTNRNWSKKIKEGKKVQCIQCTRQHLASTPSQNSIPQLSSRLPLEIKARYVEGSVNGGWSFIPSTADHYHRAGPVRDLYSL